MATFKIKDSAGNWIIPEDPTAVKYTRTQNLSDSQKQTARDNIGAVSQEYVDNAVANAGGGSGGAGYGNAPIKNIWYNMDYDNSTTVVLTQTGDTIYEAEAVLNVNATCSPWKNPEILFSFPERADGSSYTFVKKIFKTNANYYIDVTAVSYTSVGLEVFAPNDLWEISGTEWIIQVKADVANGTLVVRAGESGLF